MRSPANNRTTRRIQLLSAATGIIAGFVIYSANISAAPEYAHPQACAACHKKIADDYGRTGMGRSFFKPAASNTIEDYNGSYYHTLSGTHFSMTLRAGQYFQRRWQIGFAGKETNVEEQRVDYILGSGNHARSYLTRTARGTLIELPLGWYSEGNGHWDMSPGSDSTHPRTRRFISYRCMFCHNGVPQIPTGNEAPGSDPVYLGALPEGIDCQRCHGPGAKHIRTVQTAGGDRNAVQASIVNPARLSAKRRMEICMQCHLETTSGRIPSALIRFNRGPFSFQPGEPLDDFLLAFDHAPGTGHDAKFEAVGSVYRLRQSRCFIKSGGKLTCDTCHNPHRVERGSAAIAQFAAACRQCHGNIDALAASGRHTKSNECATCHMPKRRAEDTPGMVMTDHLIQRRPLQANPLAELRERPPEQYLGRVVPYYTAPVPPLYVAVAQVGLKNNVAEGLPVLAREVARQKPQEAEFYNVLGDGMLHAGKRPEAIAAYRQAVQRTPKSPAALRSLAAALQASGQTAAAAETLDQAIRLAPTDPITWHRLGLLDAAAGRHSSAIERIEKAISLDPSLPGQSRSLADVLLKAGRVDQARTALKDALRIDPYDDAAWNMQARLLTQTGELDEAAYSFEQSIRLNPNEASYFYDYALALARANRLPEAAARIQSAIRLNPTLAEAHELLGGLYERAGDLTKAAQEYRRVLELKPDAIRAHWRLGTVLAAQNNIAGATLHLQKATAGTDADIAAQAAQALRRIKAP